LRALRTFSSEVPKIEGLWQTAPFKARWPIDFVIQRELV